MLLASLALPACRQPPAVSREVPARPSIAVDRFTGEGADWLSTALAEMLRAELGADEKVRVASGASVIEARRDASLPASSPLESATAQDLLRRLKVDALARGRFREKPDGSVEIAVSLTTRGPLADRAAFSGEAPLAQLLELLDRAGAAVRSELGVPAERGEPTHAALPQKPEAARLYAEGLERLSSFEAREAVDKLTAAARLEPEHPLVQSALAEAWEQLGYDQKAREASELAFRSSLRLPRQARLVIEAGDRERHRDWVRAIDLYRTLCHVFPDRLDYGLELARSQILAGQRREALQTLATLRTGSDDPRINLAEAEAATALSEYTRAEASSARAVAASRASGARGLIARSLLQHALALRELGRLPEARASVEEGRALARAAHDLGTEAQALRWRGALERRAGDLRASRVSYEEALALSDRIGDARGSATSRNQLAVLLRQQGALSEAGRRHEEALQTSRLLGDREGQAIALSSVGWVRRLQGDLPRARERLTEARELSRALGNRLSESIAINTLAWLLRDAGRLKEAQAEFEETLATSRALGSERGAAFSLLGLADVALLSGETRAARAHADEASRLRERLGEAGGVAEVSCLLARIALDEGQLDQAETSARAAVEKFRTDGERDSEALARTVRARALAESGRAEEAERESSAAAALADRSENAEVRVLAGLTAASLDALRGLRVAESVARIEKLRLFAESRSLAPLALEARLANGTLERRFGEERAGRAQLLEVARRARELGLLGLARRAEPGR